MAADTFKTFFEGMLRDIKADENELAKQARLEQLFHGGYYFLVKHFTGPSIDDIVIAKRKVYMTEGARAADFNAAFKPAFKKAYKKALKNASFRKFLENYLLTNSIPVDRAQPHFKNLIQEIERREPILKTYVDVHKAVQAQIDQLKAVVRLDLSRRNESYRRFYRNKKQEHLDQLISNIKKNNPDISIPSDFAILLDSVIKWDKQNPPAGDNELPRYPDISKIKLIKRAAVSQDTFYYHASKTKNATRSGNATPKSHTRSHSGEAKSTQTVTPAIKAPMPTFGNVIGLKILLPQYIADASVTFLFKHLPRLWSKAVNSIANKIFGKNPENIIASVLKTCFKLICKAPVAPLVLLSPDWCKYVNKAADVVFGKDPEEEWSKRGARGILKSIAKSGLKLIFKLPVVPFVLLKTSTFFCAQVFSINGLYNIVRSIRKKLCCGSSEVTKVDHKEDFQSTTNSRRHSRNVSLSKPESPNRLPSPTHQFSPMSSNSSDGSDKVSPQSEVKRRGTGTKRYQDFSHLIPPGVNTLNIPSPSEVKDAPTSTANIQSMLQSVPAEKQKKQQTSPENSKERRLAQKALDYARSRARVSSALIQEIPLMITVEKPSKESDKEEDLYVGVKYAAPGN